MTWINRLKLWGGILGIAALVFALTVLFNQRQSQVASVSAAVDAPASTVGSSYGGVVTDVFVKQGQTVTAGSKLFTLNSVQLQQDVANGLKPNSTEAYDINTQKGTITYKAVSAGYVASLDAEPGSFLAGGSSMATTSVAGTMVARSWENDCRLSARPTSSRRASGWWSRNWRHAASVTRGPWSPPMQSTASVIMGDLSGRPEGPRNEYDGQNKGPRYRVCSNGPLDGVKVRLQTCSSAPDGHGRNRWG